MKGKRSGIGQGAGGSQLRERPRPMTWELHSEEPDRKVLIVTLSQAQSTQRQLRTVLVKGQLSVFPPLLPAAGEQGQVCGEKRQPALGQEGHREMSAL